MKRPCPLPPPVRTERESFQAIMAEQLRHAPWMLLSIALHFAVIAILWLIPSASPPLAGQAASVLLPEPVPAIEDTPPPDERVEPDEVDPEKLVVTTEPATEPDVVAGEASDFAAADPMADFAPSDLALATNVGLGGGTPARYAGRGVGGGRRGGFPGQANVEAGLVWLRDHQDPDGRWDCDGFMKHDLQGTACDGPGDPLHDVGVTGLALLAFLGDGSTLRSGRYADVVKRGVEWLRAEQDADTGCIGARASQQFMYDHAIATLALCEAMGLSRYRTLRPFAQKAVDYLNAARNPYGAWRYQPRSGDNDVSVTGWAVMALLAAQEFGLAVDRRALAEAEIYLDEMTDASGRVGYVQRGGPSSRREGAHAAAFPVDRNEAMTGVGMLCKALLGHDGRSDAGMQKQLAILMRKPPAWDADARGSTLDFYAWYYGSYAVYQVGEPYWSQWSRALNRAVIAHQRRDGNAAGSWDPVDAWGSDGGRVYATAILTLTLQAYYRYARCIGGR